MTDKGRLQMDEKASLSPLVASADGYSSIARGGTLLFAVLNANDEFYFSRSPTGDGQPGTRPTLVDLRPTDTV